MYFPARLRGTTAGIDVLPEDRLIGWRTVVALRSTGLPRMVVGLGLIAMSVLALAAPLAPERGRCNS